MSTHTKDKTSDKPAEKSAHDIIDDHAGVYGWFRRHQKKLLYSVGLFVLITFSVSGPMMAAVAGMFADAAKLPTITVAGKEQKLTREDFDIGRELANRTGALQAVLPPIGFGEGGRTELTECYAILRRAAIAEGFEASLVEVDRAIATLMDGGSIESQEALARQFNFGSLAAFKQLLAEGMRIGTMLKLQTLGLDSSEASVLEGIIKDKEKISLRVATFDAKALEEELKAKGGVTAEDLMAWLDTKDDMQKRQLDVFAGNQSAMAIGALMLDQYDRSEWSEMLDGFEIGDEQRTRTYKIEQERFKNEDGTFKPEDDEEVIATLDKLIETEHLMGQLFQQLSVKRNEFCQESNEERSLTATEFFKVQGEVAELEKKVADNPEDENARADLELKKELLVQRESQKKAAEEDGDARYAEFGFEAEFKAATAGKTGIVFRSFAEPRGLEELKDLEAGDLGLGTWAAAQNGTFHRRKGDFSFQAQRSTKAAFIYQVTDVLVDPLKPKEELEPLLEGAYFAEKAQEQAETAKTKLEEALLRLAKARIPEKVAEIDGERQSRIDEKVAAWEQETSDSISDAEEKLADSAMGKQARVVWTKTLEQLKALLAAKEKKAAEFGVAVDIEIEAEIAELALHEHQNVLDEAAAEAGFTVTDIGPWPRHLSSRRDFDRKDPTVIYMFRNHSDLEKGEATAVVQDATERRWHAAWCKTVAPLQFSDVTRREVELERQGGMYFGLKSYAAQRATMAFTQAFTKEALEQRYAVERPTGTQHMDKPVEGEGEGEGQGQGEGGKPPK